MRKTDVLFKQTVLRVGYENMQGVERLIEQGHHGIAEKHTVAKLLYYVRALEKKCGIDIPDSTKTLNRKGLMRINYGDITYYAPSASSA